MRSYCFTWMASLWLIFGTIHGSPHGRVGNPILMRWEIVHIAVTADAYIVSLVMSHCMERGREIIVGHKCHIYLFEQGGTAQVRIHLIIIVVFSCQDFPARQKPLSCLTTHFCSWLSQASYFHIVVLCQQSAWFLGCLYVFYLGIPLNTAFSRLALVLAACPIRVHSDVLTSCKSSSSFAQPCL